MTARAKRPIWMWLSLGLNVFLIAAIVGHVLLREPRRGQGAGLRAFLRDAAPEVRALARELRDESLEELRAQRARVREASRKRREALVAEPFAQEAFDAAQAAFRAERTRFRTLIDARLSRLVATLPAAERARLAEALSRRRGGRRHGP